MTAPAILTPDLSQAAQMRAWAEALASGGSAPVGEYHTIEEWRAAAQYALDSEDWSEFFHMLGIEDAHERYGEWAMRFPVNAGDRGTEFMPPLDFEDWLERNPLQSMDSTVFPGRV